VASLAGSFGQPFNTTGYYSSTRSFILIRTAYVTVTGQINQAKNGYGCISIRRYG
jgi:hypothetical protein